MSIPKLSVVVTSYNHEAYVRQCLDSYLAQQVDFAIEIVIADDASADGTQAIILDYALRHPDIIRPILRSVNLGLNANLGDALLAARGEYITLCDADDYVIDPLKLSRQVAYLDAHPETAVSFHPVQVLWEGETGEGSVFPPIGWRDDMSLLALIARNFIQVNAAVYRRLPNYTDVLPLDLMPQDWYLHIRHAQHGNIAMMPETMSVYRRHGEGMFAMSNSDPVRFWTQHGPGHAAFCEAVLNLFPGDAEVERNLTSLAARTFGSLAAIADDTARTDSERALFTDASRRYPRVELLAVRGQQVRIAELSDTLTNARERIAHLEARVNAARSRIHKQKDVIAGLQGKVLEQRARFKKLRHRVDRQRNELQSVRERTLHFRVSRLAARVRPDRTA